MKKIYCDLCGQQHGTELRAMFSSGPFDIHDAFSMTGADMNRSWDICMDCTGAIQDALIPVVEERRIRLKEIKD